MAGARYIFDRMNRPRYFIRSVMRAYLLPAELLRIEVDCWRCTWYINTRLFVSAGTMDGVGMQNFDPSGTATEPVPLVFGGYMTDGVPVPFRHAFEFQGHGFGTASVVCVLEFMEPISDATR